MRLDDQGIVVTGGASGVGRAYCLGVAGADVVGTLVFLVSDDSAFITGQTILVDGGASVY